MAWNILLVFSYSRHLESYCCAERFHTDFPILKLDGKLIYMYSHNAESYV